MQAILRLAALAVLAVSLAPPSLAAEKDQSRLQQDEAAPAATTPGTVAPGTTTQAPDTSPAEPPAAEPAAPDAPDAGATPGPDDNSIDGPVNPEDGTPESATGEDDGSTPDGISLGEIPLIKSVELTPDMAKRALDLYIAVKAKYADTDLDEYEVLQDFVEKSPRGREFEADVKAAGFATADEWNLAITTLGFAYTGVLDDPTDDINGQIADIEADTSLAQDIKDRMTTSLKAMIPSDNNKKVVDELMKDPVYAEKLKQLDTEEE